MVYMEGWRLPFAEKPELVTDHQQCSDFYVKVAEMLPSQPGRWNIGMNPAFKTTSPAFVVLSRILFNWSVAEACSIKVPWH